MIRFEFAPIYKPMFTTSARYIHLWGGRGRGGSFTATQYALMLLTGRDYFRGYFMREVFNDIRDSLWRDLKDRIEENETLNESDFAFNDSQMTVTYIPTGNSITAKGFKKSSGNRTAKLKSIAGATHVFIEEAEENSEDNFRQLDDSLRTKKAATKIVMVFNPPNKNHWIIKRWYFLSESKLMDGYYEAKPKEDPALLSIFSTWEHNYTNLNESFRYNYEVKYKEEHYSGKAPDESYYPVMVLGLISEGLKGRIFKGWERITYMPNNWEKRYGLDFGWNDPIALVEVEKKDRNAWGNLLIYQSGITIDELSVRMEQLKVSKRSLIVADNAAKESIEALKRKGWNIVPCDKPKVTDRVKYVKQFKVHLTDSSAKWWEEYENYAWALDQFKNPIDQPIDKFNHAMDAFGYVLAYEVEQMKLKVI